MDGKERRNQIVKILEAATEPLTGTALARQLGISRQVVVGDMAILRAAGIEIYATPRGYVIPAVRDDASITAKLACAHNKEGMAEELGIIIDHGGKVLDVIVEHSIYGEIKANLMLASRRDLEDFLAQLSASGAEPLSVVTGGTHLHTVKVPSEQVLKVIQNRLRERHILLD